ncbi:Uncharacterized protein FWK35_00017806 [Aphis craccivora]|uniref:Uncharacterized protein n=1 Tax=Aphis craccivora TaxID=307492 RepID=A0A6G0Y927_APHCR|nr:Uncharacterized protein FWK35_00017806 [Aphis craccivora]
MRVGDSKPRGLNTLAISDSTVRFVELSFDGCTLNENVSATGSHFRPRTLRSECSLLARRTDGDMARSSLATVSRSWLVLLAHFRRTASIELAPVRMSSTKVSCNSTDAAIGQLPPLTVANSRMVRSAWKGAADVPRVRIFK